MNTLALVPAPGISRTMRAWYSIIILLGGLAPKASGQELAKLVASDAAEDDYFGDSVAVSGDLVVVGAYANSDADERR